MKTAYRICIFTAVIAAALTLCACAEGKEPVAEATPEPTAVPTATPEPVFSAPWFGETYPEDAKEITVNGAVSDAELREIVSALPLFPVLERLTFTDTELTKAQAEALGAASDAELTYPVTFLGTRYPDNRPDAIDLTGGEFPGCDTLLDALAAFDRIGSVDLHGCPYTEEELLKLRAAYPSVNFRFTVTLIGTEYESDTEFIDLQGTKIKQQQMDELYAKLGLFTRLSKLDMCKCGPSNEEMDALNKAFPDIRVVWAVKLRGAHTWWVRTDAKSFSTALASNPKKQLWSRDVQPLIYCTDLEGLDLGHNEVRDLDFLHYLPKLRYLILVGCGIKDITPIGELKDLEYLEIFANDIVDVSPLRNCTRLVDLNLARCDIVDLTPIKELTSLKRVWASTNKIPKEQQEELQAALPDCTFDFLSYSPTGNGWRKHERFYAMREFFGLGIID